MKKFFFLIFVLFVIYSIFESLRLQDDIDESKPIAQPKPDSAQTLPKGDKVVTADFETLQKESTNGKTEAIQEPPSPEENSQSSTDNQASEQIQAPIDLNQARYQLIPSWRPPKFGSKDAVSEEEYKARLNKIQTDGSAKAWLTFQKWLEQNYPHKADELKEEYDRWDKMARMQARRSMKKWLDQNQEIAQKIQTLGSGLLSEAILLDKFPQDWLDYQRYESRWLKLNEKKALEERMILRQSQEEVKMEQKINHFFVHWSITREYLLRFAPELKDDLSNLEWNPSLTPDQYKRNILVFLEKNERARTAQYHVFRPDQEWSRLLKYLQKHKHEDFYALQTLIDQNTGSPEVDLDLLKKTWCKERIMNWSKQILRDCNHLFEAVPLPQIQILSLSEFDSYIEARANPAE